MNNHVRHKMGGCDALARGRFDGECIRANLGSAFQAVAEMAVPVTAIGYLCDTIPDCPYGNRHYHAPQALV